MSEQSMSEHSDIAQYAAKVGAALADLPEDVRNDLLEDLPAHLAEVAAELRAEGGGATLADRLGPPGAYAAELRATLGHTGGPSRPAVWAGRVVSRVRGRWHVLDRRLGPVIGYERLGDFLALLRPAWWVVRGWLAAMLVAQLWRDHDGLGLLPRLEGSTLLGLLVLAGFVVGSIWLGRRTAAQPPARRSARIALGGATAVLAVFGVVLWSEADDRSTRYWDGQPVGGYAANPYDQVSDVFVLGADGQVVQGARLVDQDGNPVLVGWCAQSNHNAFDANWEWRIVYPACPDITPPRLPWAPASPAPLPWASPSPGAATPSPSADPAGATPSASVPSPTPSTTTSSQVKPGS
jgi:hypothetical protein